MRHWHHYQFIIGLIVGTEVAIAGGSTLTIAAVPKVGAISPSQITQTVVTPSVGPDWLAQRRVNNPNDFFERGQDQLEREITRLQQQPPSSVLTVDAASDRWQPILSKAGNFSIWMAPGTLTEETKDINTAIGQLTFSVTAANSGKNRSVVAYSDLPQTATTQPPDKILSAVRDRLKSHSTYPLTGDRTITLNGYPGRELTLQGSNETITIRFYLVKNRLYLVGIKSQGTTPNNLVSTFLNSFQLLN